MTAGGAQAPPAGTQAPVPGREDGTGNVGSSAVSATRRKGWRPAFAMSPRFRPRAGTTRPTPSGTPRAHSEPFGEKNRAWAADLRQEIKR